MKTFVHILVASRATPANAEQAERRRPAGPSILLRVLLARRPVATRFDPAVTSEEVVIVLSLWRAYDSTVRATSITAAAGAAVVVITDDEASEVAALGGVVLVVSSEGTGFFPPLMPSPALAPAIVVGWRPLTCTAARDSDHTTRAGVPISSRNALMTASASTSSLL